jgi:hypothetical protein
MRVRRSLTMAWRQPASGSQTRTGCTPPTLVLVVLARRLPRRDRAGRTDLGEQLAAGLVQADLRAARIIGAGGDPEHVRHPPAEFGVLLGWDAPALPSATA